MATGKVKWFNNAKGYGFIRPDVGGEDLFVHYSYICMEGYRSLKAGQQVTYEPRQAPKGLHAMNINLVDLEEQAMSSHAASEASAPEVDIETAESNLHAEAV